MKKFEAYIKSRQAELELDNLDEQIWLNIQSTLKEKQRKGRVILLRSLAAAIALLLVSLFAINHLTPNPPATGLSAFKSQYGLLEEELQRNIDYRLQVLTQQSIPTAKEADFNLLIEQLHQLDDMYKQYLQYLERNGYNEFLGNQILNYYKYKLELLEKIQLEIESINQYEKKYLHESSKTELAI